MDCFAIRKGRCTVLNVQKCVGSKCSFCKTRTQFQQDREKALKRISTFDGVTIRHISETYYDGKLEGMI
ncbi:hypothetical protein SAMN02745207_01623 [Clostridium grantii DSM 8605]|uniref:Uncharacterized protein n=2 Tax=Clostridium TaxID=1485 RepID=A0A1M5U7Q0_9CLOT|nr:hypothetical protein SAMN02745207_01623 [Clostridium grantii DSM 8605]